MPGRNELFITLGDVFLEIVGVNSSVFSFDVLRYYCMNRPLFASKLLDNAVVVDMSSPP